MDKSIQGKYIIQDIVYSHKIMIPMTMLFDSFDCFGPIIELDTFLSNTPPFHLLSSFPPSKPHMANAQCTNSPPLYHAPPGINSTTQHQGKLNPTGKFFVSSYIAASPHTCTPQQLCFFIAKFYSLHLHIATCSYCT